MNTIFTTGKIKVINNSNNKFFEELLDALNAGKGKYKSLSCEDVNDLINFSESVVDWIHYKSLSDKQIANKMHNFDTEIRDRIPRVIAEAITTTHR